MTHPVVYTLGSGSTWGDNELRYSIRSFVQHYGVERVIVIGHKPDWYIGEHYPMKDTVRKAYNIHMKTMKACDLTGTFIQAADDHYLLQRPDWTPHYNGLLTDKRYGGYYGKITAATAKAYPGGKFFNLHYPMRINSDLYRETVGALDWSREEYLIKSAYCNGIGIEGKPGIDCKLNGHVRYNEVERYATGRMFLSSSNPVPLDFKRWLEQRFPTPSKWEM